MATRRALAAQPAGIINVSFITLRRLAEQIAGPILASAGRRPISAPQIASAIRAVLTATPGVFTPVANHRSTEQALTRVYRELRSAPDESLDAVAACTPRAADVVRIQRQARQRVMQSWYDEEDLLASAAAALVAGDAHIPNPVILHLVPSLTAGEASLVRALSDDSRLTINVGLTGDADVDSATASAFDLAGIALPQGDPVAPPCATDILSATDPDDEVRAVVQAISGWLHEGIRLGRVAVLYPTADPYARLLHEHLRSAELPFNGTPVRSIGDMLYGRTIRHLLALVDRDFRRIDVLGLLADAPILDGDDRVPSRAWERVSRAAGVVKGSDWDGRLRRWAATQRVKADEELADGLEWRADHRRREAARAEALSTFVIQLQRDLDADRHGLTWADHVHWIVGIVDRYLGTDRRRSGWPDDELEAARRIEGALDRLSSLDSLDGPAPTVELFRRTLDSELSVSLQRVGRAGDGVFVGPISAAAGVVFDRVAVVGLSEGRFPSRRLEDPLLPDAERRAAAGHLPLRSHRVIDDRRDLLAAIASADRVLLSHPRGDLRKSTEQPASRWLLADAARLANTESLESGGLQDHSREPWFSHVASFASGLARTDNHATAQQLRLAAIARGSVDHSLVSSDIPTQAALEVVRARRSREFTRFDGNLAAVAAEIGLPEQISTSRLEAWAKCPRSFFFGHLLGVERIEEPERRFDMDPLTRGTLVHSILEDFMVDTLRSDHSLNAWTHDDHVRLKKIAATHFDRAEAEGSTGLAILWRAERIRLANDLRILLERDNQRLATGYRPVRAEMTFAEVPIGLPSGHTIRMRGSIDRVDRGPSGSLAVIDYKTGSAGAYNSLSESNPHHHGQRLQLFVYAQAALAEYPDASEVRADYWFTKEDKQKGYSVTYSVRELVASAIDTIATGIGAGVFPAHPADQPTWGWVDCWFCTPDGLSDQHERKAWERKKDDPALSVYLALLNDDHD